MSARVPKLTTTSATYRRRVHFRVGPYFDIALQQIVDQGRVFSAHFFKKHQPGTGRLIRLSRVHRLLPGQTARRDESGCQKKERRKRSGYKTEERAQEVDKRQRTKWTKTQRVSGCAQTKHQPPPPTTTTNHHHQPLYLLLINPGSSFKICFTCATTNISTASFLPYNVLVIIFTVMSLNLAGWKGSGSGHCSQK